MSELRDIYLDTNVIIDLVALECLIAVLGTPSAVFHVTENVLTEVIHPEEASLIRNVVANKQLDCVSITEVEVLRDYARLKGILGDGEAATLAVASHCGATMASDEKGAFRREALKRLGEERICGTPELLAQAITHGCLRLQDLEANVQALTQVALASNAVHRVTHFARVLDDVRSTMAPSEAQDI